MYPNTLGIGLLSVATVIGMLKTSVQSANRYVLPGQTINIQPNELNNVNNPINREREDASPVYISYSETQRTPSCSGKY